MKIQLFSLSGLWCGLQKFLWPFSFFLRSLMPKKSSGTQKILYLNRISPQKINKPKIPFYFTVYIYMYLGYKMNHFLPMIKIVKVNQSYRKLFVLFSSVQILFFTKKSYTHQSIIWRFQFSTTKTFRA